MSSIHLIKQQKRAIVAGHLRPKDLAGLIQLLTTLLPLAALWCAATWGADVSYWIIAAILPVMTLFLLRAFALMHDCGHGCLFRTPFLNRSVGFALGVVLGMPQYVWAQHHHYHHTTNGNWAKYRGALNILSVAEFGAMSGSQQLRYERTRSVWMAPFAGFIYLLLNPRLTWIRGIFALAAHVLRKKRAQPNVSIREHVATFETRCWNSPREFRHMTANNLILFAAWVWMSSMVGPALFFPVYALSLSLAGGAGLVLFTVQHNFEHSYASDDHGWDPDVASIEGTSFLVLPRWLNWFTLDIAFHHVHHLSAGIPNYCLAACHEQNKLLFRDVPRLRLRDIGNALKFILWHAEARRIVSVAEYRREFGAKVKTP